MWLDLIGECTVELTCTLCGYTEYNHLNIRYAKVTEKGILVGTEDVLFEGWTYIKEDEETLCLRCAETDGVRDLYCATCRKFVPHTDEGDPRQWVCTQCGEERENWYDKEVSWPRKDV